jgi:hypothetical protein
MEDKTQIIGRISEYFIRMVMMFTVFLALLFFADYYNKKFNKKSMENIEE